MKKIIVAAGCFWGVEHYYKRLKGIMNTRVGYTDGPTENPTYKDVCDNSGHVEAVWIEYDEEVISLEKICEHFFRIVDPTQRNRQGHDFGVQYRNGFFLFTKEDEDRVLTFIEGVRKNYAKPLSTFVKQASEFYDAETYHQHYLEKNPSGYCHVNMSLAKKEELKSGE